MKNPFHRLALILALCTLIVLTVAYGMAQEGFRHVEPDRELRLAGEDWQDGHPMKAFISYMRAWLMAIDAGARWKIADIYVEQMVSESVAGETEKALAHCQRAVETLRGYDDEGSLSYECFAIEAEIERQAAGSSSP